MTEPARVLVADDHPLLREGVVRALNAESGITVVGEAGTGEEALRLSCELMPDLVILDLKMPHGGGLEATSRIAALCPVTKILILTISEEPDDLLSALKSGARGYLLKGVRREELIAAVRSVLAGNVQVSPTLASGILHEMTKGETPDDPFSNLSDRERDILQLVAEGRTNREIGEELFLSEKTIKYYMTNVLQKLHVRSRVEAALLAQRREFEQRAGQG